MPIICPSILADNAHTFRTQIERVESFATRIQIDLTDGIFTPNKTLDIDSVYWPESITADVHLMYQHPFDKLSALIKLKPSMVIVHAEAELELEDFIPLLKAQNIRVGVALLPKTDVDKIKHILGKIDHVLIFAGSLGSFGGVADLSQVYKIDEIKKHNPTIETGWDGGINDLNIGSLVAAGIDVLNVGGFIQRSEEPAKAYAKLKEELEESQ